MKVINLFLDRIKTCPEVPVGVGELKSAKNVN